MPQRRLPNCREGADHNRSPIGNVIVDLISYGEHAQQGVVRRRAEIDRLDEDLEKMAVAVPPVAALALAQ